jgi:hypothetical protein
MDNMEKMMQQILAQMNANAKANQEDMLSKMAADQENMAANKEELLARMDKMDAIMAKAAKQEEMLAQLNAKMDANLAVIKSTINAFKEKMEPNPEENEAVVEHQNIPSEDVVVMPVGEPRKRLRVRKSTAGRRGEPKELNRGNHRSRRKLAAASRKVSRHVAVVWRKRKLFRRTGTQEICGRRKELAIAGIRMTHCAQVVRRKGRSHEGMSVELGRWKNQTKNKFARGTSKSRTPRRRQRATQQGNKRTRKRNPKELQRESMGNVIQAFGKTTGLNFEERVSRSTVGLRRIRKWTLWRGRPPQKRKNKFQAEREPVM